MTGDDLDRAYAAIIDEARAHIAAGREPNLPALEARMRAATERAQAPQRAERRALEQLRRVLAVHRARSLVAREPVPPPPPVAVPPRRAVIRARPTITGNMEVRREADGTTLKLSWDRAPRVASWEVRISEREGARPRYAVRDTVTLPETATSVDVRLGDRPLRVHLLGRSRDGRLLQRAIVSGLTLDSWRERWQRRASAS